MPRSKYRDSELENIVTNLVDDLQKSLDVQDKLIGDVFGKFERGEDSASVLGRISSILVPLSVILKYPILGTGAEAFRDVYMNVSKSIFGFPIDPQGMATNTILNAGTVYGIWFAIFLIAISAFETISSIFSFSNLL